jgi:hypothetical protein
MKAKGKIYKRKKWKEQYVCRSVQIPLNLYEDMLDYMETNKMSLKNTIIKSIDLLIYQEN